MRNSLLSWDRIKFKLLVYNILGISISFFIQGIFTYNIVSHILASNMNLQDSLLNYAGVAVVNLIITVLVLMFYAALDSGFKNRVTLLGYYEYLTFIGCTKIVNHSKLGRFMLHIDLTNGSTKIHVYDVGYMSLREIDYFFLNGSNNDIEILTKFVNQILDNEYEKRLEEIKKKESEEKRKVNDIDFIKKWDGYLDLEGKRDDKIEKILKN
jgi:hypothetical protein